MKSSILKTYENCERGIYFIDPEDKEFKETIKNARKKLETSVAPAMPCKIMKKNCGSGHPTKLKQNLRVFWELMNLRDCVLEIHYQINMKTILQEKETVHYYSVTIEKLEKIPAWNLTKVRSKKQVIDDARTSGAKVHFASLMDICHLKNRQNTRNTKVELFSEVIL